IFSDSRSVLEAIGSPKLISANYIIHRIKRLLYASLNKGIKVSLAWIPAHRGIPGNEIADGAAKEAALRGGRGNFKLPISDKILHAKRQSALRFDKYLEEASAYTGQHYASLYGGSSNGPWFHDRSLGRHEIVLVNRLRANHYNLNYSLFRKNMVDSPACPCGDPRQDANHIIFYCPLSRGRSAPLNKFISETFPHHSGDIFPMLTNPQNRLCRLLLSFFKSLQLLI
ncbi:hypothetical protein ALC57_00050, partial [Trachymyrmex cornetzi]